jgi:hypothetical protein
MPTILRRKDDIMLLYLASRDFLCNRMELRRIFLKFSLAFLPSLLLLDGCAESGVVGLLLDHVCHC